MLTILIVAVLGTVILGLAMRELGVCGAILGIVIGAFMGAMVGAMIASVIGAFAPTTDKISSETKLIAFKDGSSVTGSFFLGCGSVGGKDVYMYYYQRADGGIVRGRVDADRAVIFEENRADGVLEARTQTLTHPWELWALPDTEPHYQLRVPKGTVIRQFKADLQ